MTPLARIALRLVLLTVVALPAAGCGESNGGADERSEERANYESTGVPWAERGSVRWAGQSAPVAPDDQVWSLSATRDAAVFLHDRSEPDYGDGGETFVAPAAGTVTALFSDGTVTELASGVVGIPLADPSGHLVAWMTLTGAGPSKGEVTAYDTRRRKVLGSESIDLRREAGGALTAVLDGTAYLATARGPMAWTPSLGAPKALAEKEPGWIIGRYAERLLSWHEGGLRPLPAFAGAPLLDAGIGSPSPDGRHLTFPDPEQEYTYRLLDLKTGRRVDLGLPGGTQAYTARWSADGALVVAGVDAEILEDGWDDALEVTSYACDVANGTCDELSGGPRMIGWLGALEGSAVGQLMAALEGYGS